ncbi:MAG: NADAR family protein [Ruminococcus sp.]|nr:NADAR family protein [Ruminococcus sp.]
MKIDSFRNEYFFLSNFYEAPITYEGLTYQNNEAAFQAQKCADPKEREAFTRMNPSEAKRAGRRVQLRKDWEDIKISVMADIVMAKFSQNRKLAEKLLATGDACLEEGNDWGDRIWGTVNGQGANCLGRILMDTRENLKQKVIEIKA